MTERDLMWEETDRRTYRKPTENELIDALAAELARHALEAQLKEMKLKLKKLYTHESRVFYDEAGFPYDSRVYIASGRSELI